MCHLAQQDECIRNSLNHMQIRSSRLMLLLSGVDSEEKEDPHQEVGR